MRILGIDPGMAITGYCVMDYFNGNSGSSNVLVNCGSVQTSKNLGNSERLLEIYNDIKELINTYKPDIASIERLFYFKNAKTIIPVVQAQGVILMTLEMFGVPVYE